MRSGSAKPPLHTPATVQALTTAKGETVAYQDWKWLVVLAAAVGILLLILIGPILFP